MKKILILYRFFRFLTVEGRKERMLRLLNEAAEAQSSIEDKIFVRWINEIFEGKK